MPRHLITIDGPCASGKTTFAEHLAPLLHAQVIHTDDFVIPHEEKTPARLSVPGGNCDAERIVTEVLNPWKEGRTVQYRRYDCRSGILLPAEEIPEGIDALIIEGCYCNLPMIRKFADVRLFLDTPEDVRMERLRQRESPESLRVFLERWIPLEQAYFTAYGLPDEGCIVVREGAEHEHQPVYTT